MVQAVRLPAFHDTKGPMTDPYSDLDPSLKSMGNAVSNDAARGGHNVDKLVRDDLLLGVKDECLSELSFTEKETDIYKVRYIDALMHCKVQSE